MNRHTLRLVATATLALLLQAGHAAEPAKAAAKPVAAKSAPAKKAAAVTPNAEFAQVVYKHAGPQVHFEAPQALLRAVVVLRVKVNEQNQWQAEVFRDNPDQPEMTKAALESVSRLPAPAGLSDTCMNKLRGEGVVEAWLFQTDGRFALKALAKPQKSV